MVEILALLLGVAVGVESTAMVGEIAETLLGDSALESAVGFKLQAGGAVDGVESRGENGKRDRPGCPVLP